MKKTPEGKSSVRAVLLYAVGLLLPTVLLLCLQYASLIRQRQAIRDLTAAGMRLAGARAVIALERLFEKHMDEFLRDPRTAQAAAALLEPSPRSRSGPTDLDSSDHRFLEGLYAMDHGRVSFWDRGQANSHVAEIAGLLKRNAYLLEDAELSGKVYPLAITKPFKAQLFYMAVGVRRFIIGSLDLHEAADFANQQPVPLGSEYPFRIVDEEASRLAPHEVPVRFQTMFPFWQVAVVPMSGGQTSDEWIFPLLTVFVLALLIFVLWRLTMVGWRYWEVTQLRATFVEAASHELRTPVSNILLYAQFLAGGANSSEQTREFQEIIFSEAQGLSRLVKSLLDFSRLRSGRRPLVLVTGDLGKIVQSAVRVVSIRARLKDIAIRVMVPPSLPPVQFDESAVEICILNLLDNAIKYSNAGRTVDVEVMARHNEVRVSVRDFGLGIPKDQQEGMVEPFVQLEGAPKGGVGVGLYVVKRLVEAHRGRVEVDSEPGRGSEFRLVFPM